MKRVLMVAIALFVMVPGPAEAGFFGFFEKMSGPGPFNVVGFRLTLGCRGVETETVRKLAKQLALKPAGAAGSGSTAQNIAEDIEKAAEAALIPRMEVDPDAFLRDLAGRTLKPTRFHSWQCRSAYDDRTALIFGSDVLYMWTNHNDFVNTEKRQIRAFSLMPAVDSRLNKLLEIGAAAGFIRFYSSGDTFDSFTKFAFQPFRVSYRFLAPFSESKWAEVPIFRFSATVIPNLNEGNFRRPGIASGGVDDFEEHWEVSWSAVFVVDIWRVWGAVKPDDKP